LLIQQAALANYKILLKGREVVEAKSKPVSMEGTLHFTAVDGGRPCLSVSLIWKQTEKLNLPVHASKPLQGSYQRRPVTEE
jgi:hypothetical protein